jgi:hypothetical protein
MTRHSFEGGTPAAGRPDESKSRRRARHHGLPLVLGGGGEAAEEAQPEPAVRAGGREAKADDTADESSDDPLMPLEALSTKQLTRELERRQAQLRQLVSRRDRAQQQLAELDRQIAELGGPAGSGPAGARHARPARPRRTRARNAVSLPDAIAMAVEVRATITPAEAAQLVLRNGYRSTSKNFGMMVANALAKDARFRRISRGVYERVS